MIALWPVWKRKGRTTHWWGWPEQQGWLGRCSGDHCLRTWSLGWQVQVWFGVIKTAVVLSIDFCSSQRGFWGKAGVCLRAHQHYYSGEGGYSQTETFLIKVVPVILFFCFSLLISFSFVSRMWLPFSIGWMIVLSLFYKPLRKKDLRKQRV